jgi:hypothetical protein
MMMELRLSPAEVRHAVKRYIATKVNGSDPAEFDVTLSDAGAIITRRAIPTLDDVAYGVIESEFTAEMLALFSRQQEEGFDRPPMAMTWRGDRREAPVYQYPVPIRKAPK